jgi:chaperonin GroES
MIVPLLHRILVMPDPVETKTSGGIILAVNEKREQAAAERGTVISVGETAFKDFGGDPSLVQTGTRIYYAKYAGKEVKENDELYVLLNDEDVIAIISNEE